MYLNTLSNIGLAYIMQKKSFLKDDKPITYFEIIDCAYGFIYNYKMLVYCLLLYQKV